MKHSLSDYLYADEARCVEELSTALSWNSEISAVVEKKALDLVQKMRTQKYATGLLESFLQQYSLTTQEGLALMCLAEALLRIPDKATANALIQDKVAAANWLQNMGSSQDWVVKAAGVGLLVTSKTLDSAISGIGQPFIREAMVKAMRVLGQQFVLGTDIENAIKNAQAYKKKGYSLSYDMLGEAARTEDDAQRYFATYEHAIQTLGERTNHDDPTRPGISIKLSALHPRYEYAQKERCVPVMTERLAALCQTAAKHNLALIVDAEEVDRLDLSLEIIEGVLKDEKLSGWNLFGLAIQAYQKRAYPLIEHLEMLAETYQKRLYVRLVKGAYWDTEVKQTQVMGLNDYPVFTRKVNTDLSYLACARKLFANPRAFHPLLATHNAHTVAAVLHMAQEQNADFEFQKLFGMGDGLYAILKDQHDVPVSIYAPVGPHEDLLPYLVRRLLENGANSSFVNQVLDEDVPVENVVNDPVHKAIVSPEKRHPKIVLPKDLFIREEPYGRRNSAGLDLSDDKAVCALLQQIQSYSKKTIEAAPLIDGRLHRDGEAKEILNPGDLSDSVGQIWPCEEKHIGQAFETARRGFESWVHTPARDRATILEAYADLLEKHRAELMALCIREAGKTMSDALDEIREAVDFARYYANRGKMDFARAGHTLPGPTGENNILKNHGRGVFVCISPWNFPLAIFSGQVTAALMAGNAVIAKPASPTPLIAMRAVQLMQEAGVPADVLNLLPGSGRMGAAMVAHPDCAGVAFTGSTEVAWEINKTLAAKCGPIVPLIAETGGQNAMIVDSSALPEQVVDDVILSAFGSAGQRCSALRILCLQDDIADKVITMLKGAMAELQIGPPKNLSSDIGPVIDDNAKSMLTQHREYLETCGKRIDKVPLKSEFQGHYFAPCAYELPNLDVLKGEVFGPILHVVRYKKKELGSLISQINDQGFGLTLGVHSRIESFHDDIIKHVRAGNVYVNRSMTGAIVGSQPFGGQGLSGTGPKAGGPNYLHAFATEKAISIDTTAAGGNASLVSLEE